MRTETDGSYNATAIYAYGADYIDAVAGRVTPTDEHFFTQDALYNVTAAVERSSENVVERYAYSAYGAPTILDADYALDSTADDGLSDIGNEHLFTGRRTDPETGLQLNRYRYYHASLGRWVSRDPIGYSGGGMNLFRYVDGMPANATDPGGLRPVPHPLLYSVPCGRVSVSYNISSLRIKKVQGWCFGQVPDRVQTKLIESLIDKQIGSNIPKSGSYSCELGGHCCNLKHFYVRKTIKFNFDLTFPNVGLNCVVNVSGSFSIRIRGESGNCQDCPCD
ncbi:MAG: RHS repeat-associated core domain-containing protein [Planctomycetota bacterium]